MRLDYRGREREGEGNRGGREAKAGQQQDDEGRDTHRERGRQREERRGGKERHGSRMQDGSHVVRSNRQEASAIDQGIA